jgi:hypothetical protein
MQLWPVGEIQPIFMATTGLYRILPGDILANFLESGVADTIPR